MSSTGTFSSGALNFASGAMMVTGAVTTVMTTVSQIRNGWNNVRVQDANGAATTAGMIQPPPINPH